MPLPATWHLQVHQAIVGLGATAADAGELAGRLQVPFWVAGGERGSTSGLAMLPMPLCTAGKLGDLLASFEQREALPEGQLAAIRQGAGWTCSLATG